MSNSDFKIIGAKELDSALKQLGPKFEKRIAKGAIRAGARVIAKAAKANAPVDSGTLKRSIQVVTRKSKGADVSVVARAGKKWNSKRMNAFYASMVEFGTKNKPANPFMRRAVDTTKPLVFKKIGEYIEKRIAKLAAEVK